ncbi:MAG: PEP/pyruvate-binding domain-containing protein [Sedimentisphaerales bacterium]
MNARVHLNIFWILLLFVFSVAAGSVAFGESIEPSPYWKNQMSFPDEPFRVVGGSASEPDWVKFTIILPPYDPNIVYFQDCREYIFHYHFATELLDPFIDMNTSEYDQITLYEDGQQSVLGAVIMPPSGGYPAPPALPEYGIQFVRLDPYTREEIAEMFNLVKACVIAEPDVQAFYFPSYEQAATAEANREWFELQGIELGSTGRWAQGNACYSEGWALGELKFFAGDQIKGAYLAGDLGPGDILLTDGVPAEVPFVAGIITLSPSTPSSHVAILAKTYGVPFVHLALAEDANRAQELVGHKIVLRGYSTFNGVEVRLIDVEGVLNEAEISEILALKTPAVLDISPMAHYGAYSASTEGLSPADIKYFGGKAANYGIIRNAIPNQSPVALAFSFDLWNEFLDQTIAGGNTLREEITDRLSGYTYPPSDMAALSSELEGIREDLFKDTDVTSFTPQLQVAIIQALLDPNYGFDMLRKIRFRSSTNVEDSNQFTGAGLYDSFSGCLADDLDGDSEGPCLCDANEDNERGVFRAIRKVFASFYNDNAYLERLRHDVNEGEVGMALLVHHSFPDEFELANGVAILEKWHTTWRIELVTQLGAVSVANPQDGSIPEEVSVYASSYGTYLTLVSQSNLVPLGATVMDWQDDYNDLSQLLITVGEDYNNVTGQDYFLLDLEYKKVAAGGAAIPGGGLVVKQVREIPRPDPTERITPFLINEPVEFCIYQGECSDIFANHRLKSRWLFETKNLWLTKKNLEDCFYKSLALEYLADNRILVVTGETALWPKAFHKFNGTDTTIDGWFMHHLANPRTCELYTEFIPTEVKVDENPMLTLSDIGWLNLQVEYNEPVPSWEYTGPNTTMTDLICLRRCLEPQVGDLLQHRSFTGAKGASISTSFYWPPDPGMAGGYTAPLSRWVETVIEGYTSEPIVLHGWYSQTYRPEHHNFSEHFLYEPRLEPGISQDALDELGAQDIRLIHLYMTYDVNSVTTYRFEDKPFYPADIDGDEDTDFADYAMLAERWQDIVCDECGGADLNGDGRVTGADLRELAYHWLAPLEISQMPLEKDKK